MAMSIPNLRDELKTQIEAQFGAPNDSDRLLKFCLAVSTAIINHIQTNADIVLTTGDITILPDTFYAGGDPVTGTGENQGITLSSKIE